MLLLKVVHPHLNSACLQHHLQCLYKTCYSSFQQFVCRSWPCNQLVSGLSQIQPRHEQRLITQSASTARIFQHINVASLWGWMLRLAGILTASISISIHCRQREEQIYGTAETHEGLAWQTDRQTEGDNETYASTLIHCCYVDLGRKISALGLSLWRSNRTRSCSSQFRCLSQPWSVNSLQPLHVVLFFFRWRACFHDGVKNVFVLRPLQRSTKH